MSVGHNGINVVRNGRAVWEPSPCGTPHHNYPETLCTEPAGHYRPDRDPHAGPLIIDGREIGGAAWDEPKETRMADQTATQATELNSLRREVAAARRFAAEMRDFCSPYGVAADYADRLIEAMDRAKAKGEQA